MDNTEGYQEPPKASKIMEGNQEGSETLKGEDSKQ